MELKVNTLFWNLTPKTILKRNQFDQIWKKNSTLFLLNYRFAIYFHPKIGPAHTNVHFLNVIKCNFLKGNSKQGLILQNKSQKHHGDLNKNWET